MKFAVIEPATQSVTPVECDELHNAYALAGLTPLQVDHGLVTPGIGIVVYEYGLFTPPDQQAYFAIFGRLYAGNAVLYAINEGGETIDLVNTPRVVFMPSAAAVERSIELGLVVRPQIIANGVVTWQWPDAQSMSQ